jgi:AraC-like DNA-binding protein
MTRWLACATAPSWSCAVTSTETTPPRASRNDSSSTRRSCAGSGSHSALRRNRPWTFSLARRVKRAWLGGDRARNVVGMTPEEIVDLAHLRRARDLMDRDYAQPLDVPAMARAALMSPAHFSRKFRAAYGETPYSYLMTRRIERAKAFLRQGMSVTDTCVAVGCTSLGSFSSRFTEIVGETPSQYRARDHRDLEVVPSCVSLVATRPRRTSVTV